MNTVITTLIISRPKLWISTA